MQVSADIIGVSVITGFLGSGKTTLLNYLLQHPEIDETAVLINEFGEVGLDHLLVTKISEDVVLLASGCICCTVQGELVDGLKRLYVRRLAGLVPPFKRVVIETTGLADPIPIITCLMKDPLFKHSYRLESIVCNVDAVYGQRQLDIHAEAVRQVAVADRIVISKTDLADRQAVDKLSERIARLNPGARVISAVHGQVAPSQLFDATPYDPTAKSLDVQHWLNESAYGTEHGHDHDHAGVDLNRHDNHIVSFCIYLDRPIDWQPFLDWYEDLATQRGEQLLRVKGLVNITGEEAPFVIHCVQATRHTPVQLPAWPDEDRRTRIVFITYDLSKSEIEESLRKAGLIGSTAGEKHRATTSEPAASSRSAASGGGLRWLNEAEIGRAFAVLAGYPDEPAADVLRFMLLTGARSEDVINATWDQMDLGRKLWLKPNPSSFSGQPSRIRLSAPAVLMLEKHSRSMAPGKRLFPDRSSDGPITNLNEFWAAVAKAAEIRDADLKYLSPTLARYLFDGLEEDLVRRLLGLASTQQGEVPRSA